MARYRLRTSIRKRLPWFAIDAGVAAKGRNDCGRHEWYLSSGDEWRCYHCEPGLWVRDVISSVLLLVEENECTHAIGRQETLHEGLTTYTLGPYDRGECSRVLVAWARHGWIGLYTYNRTPVDVDEPIPDGLFERDQPEVLRRDVAERLLGDWTTWDVGRWSGWLFLFERGDPPDDDTYRQVAQTALGASAV